nr:cupin domain-containing protein [Caldovatus aquaticus]
MPGADPARFRALLSVADLDAFLRTDAARAPRVSMADSARQGSAAVPEHEYADGDGRVDLPRLLARFDAGATLVVSQFHELHAPLARFCRGLERAFLHPVQANIYLTPPGAQGFRLHYDTHDVLVLQVEGTKRWRIWPGQPVPHPTRRIPWAGSDAVRPEGEPATLTLMPGDALYLPRGVMHDAAVAQGVAEASLHVTVGLFEPAWAEAARELLTLLEADTAEGAALRQGFPSWRLADPEAPSALAAALAGRLAALATPAAVERLALRLLDRLATERLPLPARGLLTPPPGPADRLRLADSMHHHLVPLADGGSVLRWGGGAEALDATRLAWLQRLEEGATPAELGGAEALAFCRRLAGFGLLERIG